MYNITHEPELISNLQKEYFELINFYHNIGRPSFFVKYHNLNTSISPNDSDVNATFDRYTKTENKWDLFELTPIHTITPIQNTPSDVPDLKGQMIEGNTTITTYTVENPKIDDLISFYDPVGSEEVFRVANMRLQLNSLYSTPSINWFELDLETAPIKHKHLLELNINEHYIYDLSQEKNINYADYKKFISFLTEIENQLDIFTDFYSSSLDLYHADGLIPAVTNELIFLIKKSYNDKYKRLFENIRSPFGYWDKFAMIYNDINNIQMHPPTFTYKVFDMSVSSWINYEWEYTELINPDTLDKIDSLFYATYILCEHIKRSNL